MPGSPPRPLVLFATSAGTAQLTEDDRLFAGALRRRGVDVCGAVWDDAAVDWARADIAIVRSTWDYHLRRDEFLAWAGRIAAEGVLHNELPLLRWNSHKGYLAQLSAKGIATIDTVFVARESAAGEPGGADVTALARMHGWHEIVVKPAVSAAAYETRRFAPGEWNAAQAHLARLARAGDVMLQPYLAGLGARGELSLVFARGAFSHAVRRRSALVDEHAIPTSAPAEAPAPAIHFAERVLAAALAVAPEASGQPPLYARVDLAEVAPDASVLLELELIEPSLFLLHAPHAAETFADAAVRMLLQD